MKIIVSIWKKNMTKFFRNKMECIGTLIQPMLWLFIFSVGMSRFISNSNNAYDYLSFVLPGMIGFTLISACINGGTTWLNERLTGIVKVYRVAPISRIAPLVANILTVLSKALIQSAVIMIFGVLLGAKINISILQTLIALIMIILFGIGFSGVALYFASKAPNSSAYHMIIFLFQMPLLFFSNALYTAENLPVAIRIIVSINPMTYLISGLRNLLMLQTNNAVTSGVFFSIMVLSLFAFGGLGIAKRAYNKIIYQD